MGRRISPVTERRRARRAARAQCKAEGKRVKVWVPEERKRVAGLIVQMRAHAQQQIAQLRAQTAEVVKLERDRLAKRIKDARAAARLGKCVDLTAGPALRMFGPKAPAELVAARRRPKRSSSELARHHAGIGVPQRKGRRVRAVDLLFEGSPRKPRAGTKARKAKGRIKPRKAPKARASSRPPSSGKSFPPGSYVVEKDAQGKVIREGYVQAAGARQGIWYPNERAVGGGIARVERLELATPPAGGKKQAPFEIYAGRPYDREGVGVPVVVGDFVEPQVVLRNVKGEQLSSGFRMKIVGVQAPSTLSVEDDRGRRFAVDAANVIVSPAGRRGVSSTAVTRYARNAGDAADNVIVAHESMTREQFARMAAMPDEQFAGTLALQTPTALRSARETAARLLGETPAPQGFGAAGPAAKRKRAPKPSRVPGAGTRQQYAGAPAKRSSAPPPKRSSAPPPAPPRAKSRKRKSDGPFRVLATQFDTYDKAKAKALMHAQFSERITIEKRNAAGQFEPHEVVPRQRTKWK